jgi:dTDP-4-amino-4,6-dideoxygalactose transaminase
MRPVRRYLRGKRPEALISHAAHANFWRAGQRSSSWSKAIRRRSIAATAPAGQRLAMQRVYARRNDSMEDFPNAYRMYANEISLPIYPSLSRADQVYLCDTLERLIT